MYSVFRTYIHPDIIGRLRPEIIPIRLRLHKTTMRPASRSFSDTGNRHRTSDWKVCRIILSVHGFHCLFLDLTNTEPGLCFSKESPYNTKPVTASRLSGNGPRESAAHGCCYGLSAHKVSISFTGCPFLYLSSPPSALRSERKEISV